MARMQKWETVLQTLEKPISLHIEDTSNDNKFLANVWVSESISHPVSLVGPQRLKIRFLHFSPHFLPIARGLESCVERFRMTSGPNRKDCCEIPMISDMDTRKERQRHMLRRTIQGQALWYSGLATICNLMSECWSGSLASDPILYWWAWESNRWWFRYLVSWYPHRRPAQSSWLLASTWCSTSALPFWGLSQILSSYSLPLSHCFWPSTSSCHSAFQINLFKNQNMCIQGINIWDFKYLFIFIIKAYLQRGEKKIFFAGSLPKHLQQPELSHP